MVALREVDLDDVPAEASLFFYDPMQPRHPRGMPPGGQWSGGSSGIPGDFSRHDLPVGEPYQIGATYQNSVGQYQIVGETAGTLKLLWLTGVKAGTHQGVHKPHTADAILQGKHKLIAPPGVAAPYAIGSTYQNKVGMYTILSETPGTFKIQWLTGAKAGTTQGVHKPHTAEAIQAGKHTLVTAPPGVGTAAKPYVIGQTYDSPGGQYKIVSDHNNKLTVEWLTGDKAGTTQVLKVPGIVANIVAGKHTPVPVTVTGVMTSGTSVAPVGLPPAAGQASTVPAPALTPTMQFMHDAKIGDVFVFNGKEYELTGKPASGGWEMKGVSTGMTGTLTNAHIHDLLSAGDLVKSAGLTPSAPSAPAPLTTTHGFKVGDTLAPSNPNAPKVMINAIHANGDVDITFLDNQQQMTLSKGDFDSSVGGMFTLAPAAGTAATTPGVPTPSAGVLATTPKGVALHVGGVLTDGTGTSYTITGEGGPTTLVLKHTTTGETYYPEHSWIDEDYLVNGGFYTPPGGPAAAGTGTPPAPAATGPAVLLTTPGGTAVHVGGIVIAPGSGDGYQIVGPGTTSTEVKIKPVGGTGTGFNVSAASLDAQITAGSYVPPAPAAAAAPKVTGPSFATTPNGLALHVGGTFVDTDGSKLTIMSGLKADGQTFTIKTQSGLIEDFFLDSADTAISVGFTYRAPAAPAAPAAPTASVVATAPNGLELHVGGVYTNPSGKTYTIAGPGLTPQHVKVTDVAGQTYQMKLSTIENVHTSGNGTYVPPGAVAPPAGPTPAAATVSAPAGPAQGTALATSDNGVLTVHMGGIYTVGANDYHVIAPGPDPGTVKVQTGGVGVGMIYTMHVNDIETGVTGMAAASYAAPPGAAAAGVFHTTPAGHALHPGAVLTDKYGYAYEIVGPGQPGYVKAKDIADGTTTEFSHGDFDYFIQAGGTYVAKADASTSPLHLGTLDNGTPIHVGDVISGPPGAVGSTYTINGPGTTQGKLSATVTHEDGSTSTFTNMPMMVLNNKVKNGGVVTKAAGVGTPAPAPAAPAPTLPPPVASLPSGAAIHVGDVFTNKYGISYTVTGTGYSDTEVLVKSSQNNTEGDMPLGTLQGIVDSGGTHVKATPSAPTPLGGQSVLTTTPNGLAVHVGGVFTDDFGYQYQVTGLHASQAGHVLVKDIQTGATSSHSLSDFDAGLASGGAKYAPPAVGPGAASATGGAPLATSPKGIVVHAGDTLHMPGADGGMYEFHGMNGPNHFEVTLTSPNGDQTKTVLDLNDIDDVLAIGGTHIKSATAPAGGVAIGTAVGTTPAGLMLHAGGKLITTTGSTNITILGPNTAAGAGANQYLVDFHNPATGLSTKISLHADDLDKMAAAHGYTMPGQAAVSAGPSVAPSAPPSIPVHASSAPVPPSGQVGKLTNGTDIHVGDVFTSITGTTYTVVGKDHLPGSIMVDYAAADGTKSSAPLGMPESAVNGVLLAGGTHTKGIQGQVATSILSQLTAPATAAGVVATAPSGLELHVGGVYTSPSGNTATIIGPGPTSGHVQVTNSQGQTFEISASTIEHTHTNGAGSYVPPTAGPGAPQTPGGPAAHVTTTPSGMALHIGGTIMTAAGKEYEIVGPGSDADGVTVKNKDGTGSPYEMTTTYVDSPASIYTPPAGAQAPSGPGPVITTTGTGVAIHTGGVIKAVNGQDFTILGPAPNFDGVLVQQIGSPNAPYQVTAAILDNTLAGGGNTYHPPTTPGGATVPAPSAPGTHLATTPNGIALHTGGIVQDNYGVKATVLGAGPTPDYVMLKDHANGVIGTYHISDIDTNYLYGAGNYSPPAGHAPMATATAAAVHAGPAIMTTPNGHAVHVGGTMTDTYGVVSTIVGPGTTPNSIAVKDTYSAQVYDYTTTDVDYALANGTYKPPPSLSGTGSGAPTPSGGPIPSTTSLADIKAGASYSPGHVAETYHLQAGSTPGTLSVHKSVNGGALTKVGDDYDPAFIHTVMQAMQHPNATFTHATATAAPKAVTTAKVLATAPNGLEVHKGGTYINSSGTAFTITSAVAGGTQVKATNNNTGNTHTLWLDDVEDYIANSGATYSPPLPPAKKQPGQVAQTPAGTILHKGGVISDSYGDPITILGAGKKGTVKIKTQGGHETEWTHTDIDYEIAHGGHYTPPAPPAPKAVAPKAIMTAANGLEVHKDGVYTTSSGVKYTIVGKASAGYAPHFVKVKTGTGYTTYKNLNDLEDDLNNGATYKAPDPAVPLSATHTKVPKIQAKKEHFVVGTKFTQYNKDFEVLEVGVGGDPNTIKVKNLTADTDFDTHVYNVLSGHKAGTLAVPKGVYTPPPKAPSVTAIGGGGPTSGFVGPAPAKPMAKITDPPPFALNTLTKVHGVHLEGAHEKTLFHAPDGNKWMFKPDTTSGNAEWGSYQVMKAIGMAAPDAHVVTIDGKQGTIQKFHDNIEKKISLSDIVTLTPKQHGQIAQHQVVDWLLSQHDTNEGALLLSKSGDVLAVDKGQAWKFLGKDKLAVDYNPNANPLAHNVLNKAHVNGQVALKRADIEQTIRSIEALSDSSFREAARAYAEGIHGKGAAAEGLLDQIVARKQNIRKDFDKFYDEMDAQRVANGHASTKPKTKVGQSFATQHGAKYNVKKESTNHYEIELDSGPLQGVTARITKDYLDAESHVSTGGVPTPLQTVTSGPPKPPPHLAHPNDKLMVGQQYKTSNGTVYEVVDSTPGHYTTKMIHDPTGNATVGATSTYDKADSKGLHHKVDNGYHKPYSGPIPPVTSSGGSSYGGGGSGGDFAAITHKLPGDDKFATIDYHSPPPNWSAARHAWNNTLTAAEGQGAGYYSTSSGAKALNEGLRQNKSMTGTTRAHGKALDAALDKSTLPMDAILYRYTRTHTFVPATAGPGFEYTDRGYSSTSVHPTHNQGFGPDTIVIRVKKGQKGAEIVKQSHHGGEMETLLPRSSRFKVIAITQKPGTGGRLIHVEYLGIDDTDKPPL